MCILLKPGYLPALPKPAQRNPRCLDEQTEMMESMNELVDKREEYKS